MELSTNKVRHVPTVMILGPRSRNKHHSKRKEALFSPFLFGELSIVTVLEFWYGCKLKVDVSDSETYEGPSLRRSGKD